MPPFPTANPFARLPKFSIKPGVVLTSLEPGGARILAVAAAAPLRLGFDVTVTCGNEAHGPTDPHTLGKALDLRVIGLSPEQIVALYKYLVTELGELFTVLLEWPTAKRAGLDPRLLDLLYAKSEPTAEHLHVQVRIGQQFPSAA